MISLYVITLLLGVTSCQVDFKKSYGGDPFEVVAPPRPRLRNAYKALKWPDKTRIPYTIDNNFSQDFKDTIQAAMREVEKSTSGDRGNCVTFRRKLASEQAHLSFMLISIVGCNSPVGRQTGAHINDIKLSKVCNRKSTVIHEIMHSLGFYHEMGRYDRDRYVNVNQGLIRRDMLDQYFKWDGAFLQYLDTLGTSFDMSSIMLYGAYGGSAYPARPVMTARTVVNRMGTDLVKHMSSTDVLRVQKFYECQQTDRNRVKLQGIQIDTHFEDNRFNKLSQARDDDIDWRLKSDSSTNKGTGPSADHSNGRGTYAYIDARRNHNKVARLESQSIPRGQYCLFMAIFIFGKDGGEFRAKYIGDSRRTPQRVDRFKTDASRDHALWQYKELDIYMNEWWKLVLEYQVGHGDSSDAGLDDVLLIQGRCKDSL